MTAEQYNHINDVIEDLYEAGKLSEEDFDILDEAIEALEKAEKYKWHDLRKNPDDLPTINGKYRVVYTDDTYKDMLECYTADFNIEFQHFGHYEQMEHNELDGSPIELWFEWDDEEVVIAWKEIDIFEGVEA